MQGLRVAGPAGGAAVTYSAPTLISNAGVRTVIRRIPILGGVAGLTIRTEQTGMIWRVAVAGNARGGKPRKLSIGMTALTFQTDMPTREREVRFIVVEGHVIPTRGLVAGGTVRAKLSAMLILLAMAGVAIAGRAFVCPVLVTLFTLRLGVFPLQFERRQVVIEFGGRPAVGGVAGGAVGAEAPLVRFIVAMAGGAILRRIGEVGERPRIEVALGAQHIDVPAVEPEDKIVFEVFSEAVHAIMTVQTGVAIGKRMGEGEGRVHLTVAGLAGVGGEDGDVAVMTVVAGERNIPSRLLMSV